MRDMNAKILQEQKRKNRPAASSGFTLFIAVVVMNLLILISFAIIEISLKELVLSLSGRDSQEAFYSADSGVECALYWDAKDPAVFPSKSGDSSDRALDCNSATENFQEDGAGNFSFRVKYYPDESSRTENSAYCADVSVKKYYDSGGEFSGRVSVESRGYNSCQETARRFERAVRIDYYQ